MLIFTILHVSGYLVKNKLVPLVSSMVHPKLYKTSIIITLYNFLEIFRCGIKKDENFKIILTLGKGN